MILIGGLNAEITDHLVIICRMASDMDLMCTVSSTGTPGMFSSLSQKCDVAALDTLV